MTMWCHFMSFRVVPRGRRGGRNHPTQTMINICPVAKDLHIGWESSQKGGKVKKRLERVLFRLFFFGMLSTLACHPLPHTHIAAFLVPRALSLWNEMIDEVYPFWWNPSFRRRSKSHRWRAVLIYGPILSGGSRVWRVRFEFFLNYIADASLGSHFMGKVRVKVPIVEEFGLLLFFPNGCRFQKTNKKMLKSWNILILTTWKFVNSSVKI